MGPCHSKKKPKKADTTQKYQSEELNKKEKEKEKEKENEKNHPNSPPKKHEENENLHENNPEIAEEQVNDDHISNVKREFLPTEIYVNHFNSILSYNPNKNNCEYGETEPVENNNGLYTLETYGSYGGKSTF